MHDPGCDRDRTCRKPAFRRSDNQSSAENFSGAFAVQFNGKQEPHFYSCPRIEGLRCPDQHSGNADVFSHSLMPFSRPSHPVADERSYLVPPRPGDFCARRAHGLIQIHLLSRAPLHTESASLHIVRFRLGHFPRAINGPTVLWSYDGIVLGFWNHRVLPTFFPPCPCYPAAAHRSARQPRLPLRSWPPSADDSPRKAPIPGGSKPPACRRCC